jgi:hypothetical protein
MRRTPGVGVVAAYPVQRARGLKRRNDALERDTRDRDTIVFRVWLTSHGANLSSESEASPW